MTPYFLQIFPALQETYEYKIYMMMEGTLLEFGLSPASHETSQLMGKSYVRLVLTAESATWAILRRPILVAFYDTYGDTDDTF